MPNRIRSVCCGVVVCLVPALASAAGPKSEELSLARRWAAVSFEPVRTVSPSLGPAATPSPGLVVLANHDRVLFNGRPDGRPLKLASVEYKRGLLCHAVSKVVVRLPGPGKRFTSIVGVDANAGGGSVVFSVKVAGAEKFRSQVLRGGAKGVPVSVKAVANVKIRSDDMSLQAASERFLGMTHDVIQKVIFQTLEGHLRSILGTLTVEEINNDRGSFAQKLTSEAGSLDVDGVKVVSLESSHNANPIIAQTTQGLKTNRWGYIEIDEKTGMSSVPGVFAGGDIVTGSATVILAMGAGRRAARGMLQYMGLEQQPASTSA